MRLLEGGSNACHDLLVLNMAMKIAKSEKFTSLKDCSRFLRQDALGLYAVEFKGQMVGCLFLSLRDGRVWVRGLYVDPEFRRRGIGTWLLAIACQKAWFYGHEFVYVDAPDKKTTEFILKSGLFWESGSGSGVLKGYGQYRVPPLDVKF